MRATTTCWYPKRLVNFVAIAQGKPPQESWFALGRLLTFAGGEPVLPSWSGSMFEYLMPLLIMPTYEIPCSIKRTSQRWTGRLNTDASAVSRGAFLECGYNAVDAHDNYQYRAFGVPDSG